MDAIAASDYEIRATCGRVRSIDTEQAGENIPTDRLMVPPDGDGWELIVAMPVPDVAKVIAEGRRPVAYGQALVVAVWARQV